MRTVILALLSALTFNASAQTQTADRVFQFQHINSSQNFLEVTTLIRTIADIQRFTLDEGEKSLGLRGTASQLKLAEWLFQQFDQPQFENSSPKSAAVYQYTMDDGPDHAVEIFSLQAIDRSAENVVRIFYLTNTKTVQMFQEVATLVRTTADIRRVFTYNAPRAMVVRGTADQVALAAWLVNAIDQHPEGESTEYLMPANSDPRGDTVVHLFHIANAASIQDFQEIATAVRTIADIRRVFTYNEPRIFVARGTADQNVLVQWLVQQLDKPAIGQPGARAVASSSPYEYPSPVDADHTIRVFYLHSPTPQEFQQTAAQIRMKTGIRRVFTYNAPRALAVRGTIDQVAMAERLVKALDEPS